MIVNEKDELEHHEYDSRMFTPEMELLYDSYKLIYADILWRWRLLKERALTLKCLSSLDHANMSSLLNHLGIDFTTACSNPSCENKDIPSCRSPLCVKCFKPTLKCAVCRLQVLGCANHCVHCGHGGHIKHIMQWFQQSNMCPTGCGCPCKTQESIFQ